MSNSMRRCLVIVILAGTAVSFSAATPQPDIAGIYSCHGTTPQGTAYAGSVEISANDEGYTMSWSIGDAGHTGTALLVDNQLSSSWGVPGSSFGIVVYKVEGDGKLVGKWLMPAGNKAGTETLVRR
jgi:hypothetical protein